MYMIEVSTWGEKGREHEHKPLHSLEKRNVKHESIILKIVIPKM